MYHFVIPLLRLTLEKLWAHTTQTSNSLIGGLVGTPVGTLFVFLYGESSCFHCTSTVQEVVFFHLLTPMSECKWTCLCIFNVYVGPGGCCSVSITNWTVGIAWSEVWCPWPGIGKWIIHASCGLCQPVPLLPSHLVVWPLTWKVFPHVALLSTCSFPCCIQL